MMQGRTTGATYGGLEYQAIITTVAILNYWTKLFFPDDQVQTNSYKVMRKAREQLPHFGMDFLGINMT